MKKTMYKAEAKGWYGWELVGCYDTEEEATQKAHDYFGHWHITVEKVEVESVPKPKKSQREPTLEEKIRACFRRY